MPNHVLNLLSFQGDPEAIEKMKQEIQNEEEGPGSIDFNKLIPMPLELAIESGSRTHDGIKLYNDFLEIYRLGKGEDIDLLTIPEESERAFLKQRGDIPEATWKLGRAACRNIQQYGCPTWYEWCNRHWDTKWNAYDFARSQDVLGFNTAWSAPHPVILKLSERYPEIAITHSWADEDIGHNCGRREYLAGEITEEYIPADGRDAYEFSADVRNEDLADYGLVLNADQTNYIWAGSESYSDMESNQGEPLEEEGMGGMQL